MNVSQVLNHLNENTYDDDITVTDIPKGYFPAAVSNRLPDGSDTREIMVDILPLEQAPGGTMHANPGLYTRQPDETSVKVTVTQDGSVLATNTTGY